MQKKEKRYSISQVLFVITLTLLCTVLGEICYIRIRQKHAMLTQIAESSLNTLDSCAEEMEEQFERLEVFLFHFFYQNKDIQTLIYEEDEVERYHARMNILEVLDQIINLSSPIDCTWIYLPDMEDSDFLIRYSNTGILGSDLTELNETIKELIQTPSDNSFGSENQWNVMICKDKPYLLWKTEINNMHCGAWIRISQISEYFEKLFDPTGSELILYDNRTGEQLSGDISLKPETKIEGNHWYNYNKEYICAHIISEKMGLTIYAILSKSAILNNIPVKIDYMVCLAMILCAILLVIIICQIFLYYPFRKLVSNIRSVDFEKPEPYVNVESHLVEIRMLTNLINSMLSEMARLKTVAYKAQVQQRDIQCQYLQIRLKTHFYINCLSIIHAMALVKNTEVIQELTLYLTRYLRFLNNDSDRFVSLKRELEHVRNYTRIQKLRFPDLFHYYEDVDISLTDCMIPPIMLETFIENSVEHGMRHDQENWVRLTARFQMKDEIPGIDFLIADSGQGFDKEELQNLCSEESSGLSEKMHGIGIRNVISRLRILYDGQAEIRFFNGDTGGARVRMWIPILNLEGEE